MAGICEELLAAVDIADVIGERVRLRPARRGYSGLCPFHEDREPSFHVYTDTQSYYCFGCHESGNVITYMMKTENVSFPEALKILAYRAGITLPEQKSGKRSAYELLDLTARFYAESLKSSPEVSEYLDKLKLDASDVCRFSLGYAHPSCDLLVSYLHGQKVADKEMEELGLAQSGMYGMYDKFRGRLIIPVKDVAGRVIGFGGRLIEGQGAKYISEIYSSCRQLYLLDRARSAIHDKKRTILASGYMDAIRLHKSGFTESVSMLGSTLTAEQLVVLSKLSEICYVCEGHEAILRSMYELQKGGINVYVINLPGQKTPEEYLTEHDPAEFEEAVRKARPLIERHIYTWRGTNQGLLKSLCELEDEEVLWYKRQISEVTGLPPSKVEASMWSKRMLREERKPPVKKCDDVLEAGLCALLLHSAECREQMTAEDVQKYFKDETAQNTALSILTEKAESLMELWSTLGETNKLELIARGEKYCTCIREPSAADKWKKMYMQLLERNKRERLGEIKSKMEKSQATAEELAEYLRLKGASR